MAHFVTKVWSPLWESSSEMSGKTDLERRSTSNQQSKLDVQRLSADLRAA